MSFLFTHSRPIRSLWKPTSFSAFKRFNSASLQYITPLAQNPVSANKINFTKQAVQRLSALALSGDSLVIKVSSGGCHGYQYDLNLVPTSSSGESAAAAREPNATEKESEDDEFGVNEMTFFTLPFLNPDKRDLIGLARSIKNPVSSTEVLEEKETPENLGESEDKEVVLMIDSNSLSLLNGTTLDFQRELIGSSFKLVGGNMKSSCGCGSSFDL